MYTCDMEEDDILDLETKAGPVMLSTAVTFVDNRLCYSGQGCHRIPDALVRLYGAKVHGLDLSFNELVTLHGLEAFPQLRELVLDNNRLPDSIEIPRLEHLHTLSLNKNNISDIESLLIQIREKLPMITYLSLLGNRACPNQLSCAENDDDDYQRYRYYVLHHLPNLQFLDSNKVREFERREAKRIGKFMNIVRPKSTTEVSGETFTYERITTFTPLPRAIRNPEDHRGAYGKCRYRYSGKHSEGNRFISNSDL